MPQLHIPGGVPMIGQQDAMIQQLIVSCYMNLVPVVAKHYLSQSQISVSPETIAETSWKITGAALKKIGINIQPNEPAA